jgi:putative ABC transport system permease protein
VGGVLLTIRLCLLAARRRGSPPGPRFGSAVGGTLARSLRRRAGELATGILVVGLVVAFGASLAMFSATYDSAKAADARFLVGADLRITPSALSPRPHPAAFAADLKVEGVSAVTPVVFRLESAVVLGVDTQDVKALAAIDPEGFHRVAALSDSVFPGGSAAAALAALRAHPDGVLVQTRTAQDLSLSPGDPIRVVLARGTKHQTQTTLRMAGAFDRFPGFPAGVDLVANLGFYASTVGTGGVDFFLADAADGTQAGVARSAGALRSGPGRQDPLLVETPANALDKDQSSLTALNIHGLLNLDSLFTLAMSAAAVAIFVLGLMLQRRREYVTLRAQGMRAGELRLLVLGEAGVVGLAGLAAGIAVGAVMAALLVHVLRPLFVLDPRVTVSMGGLGVLAALTAGATVLSAVLAAGILNRLRPTELLRES